MNTALRRLLTPAHPDARPPRAQAAGRFGPTTRAGLYLGHGTGGVVQAGPEHHVLVLGPPRSGKTSRLVVPAAVLHPGPAVVTSTKPDALAATAPWRARRGTIWYWDPTGTTTPPPGARTLRWSPVTGCEHWDTAVARAHSLTHAARPQVTGAETHWTERAGALLAPLLHAAALTSGGLPAVAAWLHRADLIAPLQHCKTAGPASTLGADLLTGLAATDPRELSGIISTADSLLAAYRSHSAIASTLQPNFDPAAFTTSADTIYLVAPATAQAAHAPLVVAFLDNLRAATYHIAPTPPVAWLLDETANIAPLPDLPATIAEAGSQGLLVMACLQDLSQARARWGDAAEGFLTLFTHKIVLAGIADVDTLDAITTLAGDTDIPKKTVTRQAGWFQPATTTWAPHRQARLPADAINRGVPGGALLIDPAGIHTVTLPAPPPAPASAADGR